LDKLKSDLKNLAVLSMEYSNSIISNILRKCANEKGITVQISAYLLKKNEELSALSVCTKNH
jgi:hypothetical protein